VAGSPAPAAPPRPGRPGRPGRLGRPGRPGTVILGAALAAVIVAGAAVWIRRSTSTSAADQLALAAAHRFLDTYLGPDGRVSRLDQGGDTVSEGQAYAMLIAVAIGDRRRFDLAWTWAQHHLQRSDGLLSSHWQGGQVVDPQPASDADLDAARALLLAAQRFGDPAYRSAALRIGGSVLAAETATYGGRRVLVAGPWALAPPAPPAYVDPSYLSPRTFAALGKASGNPAWSQLTAGGYAIVEELQSGGPALVPDWAKVSSAGVATATPAPGGGSPVYGYEAGRLLVRMAEDCAGTGRSIAAKPWRFLSAQARSGPVAAQYGLDGAPRVGYTSPLADVAAAASATAAGNHSQAMALLARAATQDADQPTYYGAAWVALGRIMLTTTWLGGC